MADRAFAGIDVAFANKKSLPLCIVRWNGQRLEPLEIRIETLPRVPRGRGNRCALMPEIVEAFAHEATAVVNNLSETLGVTIERVAIDAPSAPCASGLDRRLAEREMDRLGYSCFSTPSAARFEEIRAKCTAHLDGGGAVARLPHANQLWMLVGFALFRSLGASRTVLEVFPHSIVRTIGVASAHKSTVDGYGEQLSAAARATGWDSAAELHAALERTTYGSRHDRLDAFLSAWVAALPPDQLTPCGDGLNDVIWIPRIDRRSTV